MTDKEHEEIAKSVAESFRMERAVLNYLLDVGYEGDADPKGMVEYIEEHNLDVSNLEFPDGGYENYKNKALAGEYTIKVNNTPFSEEYKKCKGKMFYDITDPDAKDHLEIKEKALKGYYD